MLVREIFVAAASLVRLLLSSISHCLPTQGLDSIPLGSAEKRSEYIRFFLLLFFDDFEFQFFQLRFVLRSEISSILRFKSLAYLQYLDNFETCMILEPNRAREVLMQASRPNAANSGPAVASFSPLSCSAPFVLPVHRSIS